MIPPQTEKQITAAIRKYLLLRRIFHWKQWQGPMSGLAGVSDIIGIYKGRFLAIEVKTAKGKLTVAQVTFQHTVQQEGGIAFVARSVQDVEDRLLEYEKFWRTTK